MSENDRCLRSNVSWFAQASASQLILLCRFRYVITFSNMPAEIICDCDVVWLIRRLKSKANRQRFADHLALVCDSSTKIKVKLPVTKFTENDVCPQKAVCTFIYAKLGIYT